MNFPSAKEMDRLAKQCERIKRWSPGEAPYTRAEIDECIAALEAMLAYSRGAVGMSSIGMLFDMDLDYLRRLKQTYRFRFEYRFDEALNKLGRRSGHAVFDLDHEDEAGSYHQFATEAAARETAAKLNTGTLTWEDVIDPS